MRTVWHHGAWNRNFGDWVLQDSIQHHLQRVVGSPIHFVPVDSQATTYSPSLVDKLNAEADLLLVGGGGLVFHRPEDRSVSGWQFDISLEQLERVRVPVIVQGIGYNRFPFDDEPFPAILDEHLRAVQEVSTCFSVRNGGSRDELVRRGLDPARLHVVPDAGLFAPASPMPLDLGSGRPVIGVNIAGDRPYHRYPAPSVQGELRAMEALADGLADVCRRTRARVLLIPHLVDVDERFDALFRERVGAAHVFSLREIAPWLYPPSRVMASHFVGAYDSCDVVIGMRGHACLLALGRKRRFLAFGSHAKNDFLLADTGLTSARIPPEDVERDGAVADAILRSLEDETWEPRCEAVLERLRVSFDRFHEHALSELAQTRRSA